MRRTWIRFVSVLILLTSADLACSKDPTAPPLDGRASQAPETELAYAPLEGDTTSYRVHLYWNGYDRDGEVVRFRFALDADTADAPSTWNVTTATDTVLVFPVDPVSDVKGHVFWVVAEDNDGRFDPTPAKRFFSSRTVPPISRITRGPIAPGVGVGPNVTLEWEGIDPDGSESGGLAPVDSFEYLLLQNGVQLDPDHPPLTFPPSRTDLIRMIVEATGPSLPPPNDDWMWIGIRARQKQFRNLATGTYAFAVRAVDAAGARERLTLTSQPGISGVTWTDPVLAPSFDRNIRLFDATPSGVVGPQLDVCSNLFLSCLGNKGIVDVSRRPIQLFEGETLSFSWGASAAIYGGEVVGYTWALDDTSKTSWHIVDIANTTATFNDLSPGDHEFFVRAFDDGGLVTNMKVPLRIVHPTFKDPPVGRPKVLYVDDFAPPPGDWYSAVRGSPNYPKDYVPWTGDALNPAGSQEDQWWAQNVLGPLGREFGVDVTLDDEHDTVFRGVTSADGMRAVFTIEELAPYRTIIWYTDLTNNLSSPTALWRTLVGGSYSVLAGYIRAGGTVIITGFGVASQTSRLPDVPYSSFSRGGMCASLDVGSPNWTGAYFLRDFMGIDGALGNYVSSRYMGARDFIEARVTPEGAALGFASATVDVGSQGAKWDSMAFNPTLTPIDTRDTRLAPGLPIVEGWRIAETFGCYPPTMVVRKEFPGPVVFPVLTYHGVPRGVQYDLGPSPREGMVVGIATQAHDFGNSGFTGPITPSNSKGVAGRMVVLGFPMYYLRDPEAYPVMRAAFAYVNASPTLPGYSP